MTEATKFKAYAVLNAGEKLQPWEYEPAPLQVDEIEIRVTHNGLCHTDLHMRDNDWGVSQFPNGVLCFVGIPVSSLNVPLIPLIFGQKSVVGSVVGGRRFMQEMLDFAAINQIKPMIETMALSQVNEAMDKVAANKARYRIVLLSDG
jgi:D-arabinose 1-dehydrogenase-like Zn-dependent alcohol dehydrogenase